MGKVWRVFHRIQSKIYTTFKKENLTNHLHNTSQHTTLSENNKTLSSYINSGMFQQAQNLFDEMPVRDVVTWNTILLGFREAKDTQTLYTCFVRMLRAGLSPSGHTISLVLSAVFDTKYNVLVPQFHSLSLRLALNRGSFVGSALTRGYADTNDAKSPKKVFDEISEKSVSCFNALVSSYMRSGQVVYAQNVFDEMPERNAVSWTIVVDGYIKNDYIDEARRFFEKTTEKQNVISWTAMIVGLVQADKFSDALDLLASMMRSSVRPNGFTFSAALSACAGLCSLSAGQQVHSTTYKCGSLCRYDVVLSTSLVDMYAKCGDVESSFRVFDAVTHKNVAMWNAIIGGFARHGEGVRAEDMFERMVASGVGPDDVTFVNLLSGCVHGGLVRQGEKWFRSMAGHGVRPEIQHYACMVRLYKRAGEVERAVKLVEEMTIEPDAALWGALGFEQIISQFSFSGLAEN